MYQCHDDVTDLQICGFHENITQERNIIFSSNKENSLFAHQALLYCKKYFCTEGNL